jgi:hypothetical protein
MLTIPNHLAKAGRFASTRLVDLNLLHLLNTAHSNACRSMRLTELATAAAAAA